MIEASMLSDVRRAILPPQPPVSTVQKVLSARQTGVQEKVQGHFHGIQGHKDAIFKLYTRWNELLPISQLPAEILVKIFLAHIAQNSDHRPWQGVHWFNFSHVCRHWRDISLDCPSLWTTIRLVGRTAWIFERLSRTKTAPLILRAWLGENIHATTIPLITNLLAREMWRIQELQIPLKSSTTVGAAGLLTKLKIYDTSHDRLAWKSFSKIIYSNDAPLLESLDIDGNSFYWQPMCHPNLKKLSICCHSINSFTVVDVMSALGGISSLEELHLEGCLPRDIETSGSLDLNITLPRLYSLHLSSSLQSCINLLSHFRLPLVKLIELKGSLSGERPSNLKIARIELPFHTFRSCLFSLGYGVCRAVLDGGADITNTAYTRTDLDCPRLVLETSHPDRERMLSILELFWQTLPLSQVESLQVNDSTRYHRPDYTKLFSQTHSLQILHFGSHSHIGLLLSGLYGRRNHEAAAGQDISFPPVDTLEFDSVEFNNIPLQKKLECLRDSLRREDNGTKPRLQIKKIIFKDCGFSKKTMVPSLLKDIAGAVKIESIGRRVRLTYDIVGSR